MDAVSVLQTAQQPDIEASHDSSTRKLSVMPKKTPASKRKARVRGTGTLEKRGRIWWMELHWKGQRFRESLGTDDRETALIRLDEKVNAIRSGENPKIFEPITVQAMHDNWMLEVERTCKPRTIQDYKSRWETHLKPVFAARFATQIEKDDIVKYLAGRKNAGAGDITQNRENRVLQMIFGYNKEKIPADRFPQFPSMHSERNRVRKGRLSESDYKTLLTKLEDPKMFWLKAILTLTFKYGFRKSELLNAKVGYFNAKESTFTLPAFTTKNKSERVVDLVQGGTIYEMLIKLTEGRKPEDALLCRNGKPVKDYRGAWQKLAEGMTGGSGKGGSVTIHDLRRSAITGMHNKKIGAADAGTHLTSDVFNRYVARSKEERQATAKLIES